MKRVCEKITTRRLFSRGETRGSYMVVQYRNIMQDVSCYVSRVKQIVRKMHYTHYILHLLSILLS